MLHRRKNLLRTVAPTALLALTLTLTGCGSSDADGDADQASDKDSASQEAGKPGDGDADADAAKEKAANAALTVGDTAAGTHTYESGDTRATLRITADKVETGSNADLVAAGLEGAGTKGQYPVFVHFTYTVEKAENLEPDTDFNSKVGVVGAGNASGRKLVAVGGDPIRGGCPEDADNTESAKWKTGTTATLCTTYILPEGTEVEQLAWVGKLSSPLLWKAA